MKTPVLRNPTGFNMKEFSGILEAPWLVPVPIKTNTPWEKVKSRFKTRFFCLGRDWYYLGSDGELCCIPGAFTRKGRLKEYYFVTDGKSYPRPFRPFFSSVGIGLTEGLVHDFGYKYQCQILADGGVRWYKMSRHQCDEELRLVGTQVNGMPKASWISYGILRAAGIFAWNHHRGNDGLPINDVKLLLTEFQPNFAITEKPIQNPFE